MQRYILIKLLMYSKCLLINTTFLTKKTLFLRHQIYKENGYLGL